MSNTYKHGDRVPSEVLCRRLNELADAVTKGREAVAREFTMRVPAEKDRDADLVISAAAQRIEELERKLAGRAHPTQDVEEFIAKHARDRDGIRHRGGDYLPVDLIRDWMDGHVRVPVGWQFYQDGKWWHGDDRIKDHRKNTEEAGFPVRDVYADPEPTTCIGCEGVPGPKNSPCAVCGQKSTPDVTALVEALECALETMENVDGENDCSRGIDAVEEALAAHRKGGVAAYCEPEEEPTALIPLSDYEALHAECEKLRKDAERYGYIREGNHWIVAATQTGVHLDGKNLDDLIDDEIADTMLNAHKEK